VIILSRTDKTMPWKIREQDDPSLPWTWILNTENKTKRKHRERRRSNHAERRRVKNELARGKDPAPTRNRNQVVYDLM
jgi:hypothetical protein